MSSSIFVVILGLCYCTKESSQLFLKPPHLSGPLEALVKESVSFHCEIPNPKNQSILLKLFKKGDREDMLGEYTLLKGEEVASIPKKIKRVHEGDLECVASVQNNTEINSTVSNSYFFKVIEPVKGAKIVHSGQQELYEGNRLKLRCQLIAGNHVTFKWLLDGRLISPSPVHLFADDCLTIHRVTSEDSGDYMCSASNIFNKTSVFTTNSSKVVIRVKDLVSNPEISYTVLKEDLDSYSNYSVIVTCEPARGTLPINISLYNSSELVSSVTAEERRATFRVPLIMNQHFGSLQCQANNGEKTTYSRWLPIEVVQVGGPVMICYEQDMAANFAVIGLRLFCKAAKGSHPQFQWYLNKTLLRGRGSFYYVFEEQLPEQSILLLSVGRSSAGTYHCEVSDSFDNTTVIRSKGKYLDNEVLNRLPDFVVAVVFGCFTALILIVSFCCLIGVTFRRRQYGENPVLSLEMDERFAEEKLYSSDYHEDPYVIKAAVEDEFDQASWASVDEWPQIEQEKKTLEDGNVSEAMLTLL